MSAWATWVSRLRSHTPLLLLACGFTAYAWTIGRHLDQIFSLTAGPDFYALYYAAAGFSEGSGGLYDAPTLTGRAFTEVGVRYLAPFRAPPLQMVLFLPLTHLDVRLARALWLLGGQALLGLTVWGLARIGGAMRGARLDEMATGAVAMMLVFTAPFFDDAWQGQTHLVVLALVTWSLACHLREDPDDRGSGVLLGCAAALAVYPVVLLPYLWARRGSRVVAWTLGAWAAATALGLLFVPLADHLRFVRVLVDTLHLGRAVPLPGNLSMGATGGAVAAALRLPATGQRAFSIAFRWLPFAVVLVGVTPSIRRADRVTATLRLAQAFLLFACVLATFWVHHLVLLLPTFFIGVVALRIRQRPWLPAALLAIGGLIMATVHHPLLFTELLHGPLLERLRPRLWDLDRVALLLLFIALELLIRRQPATPSPTAEPTREPTREPPAHPPSGAPDPTAPPIHTTEAHGA